MGASVSVLVLRVQACRRKLGQVTKCAGADTLRWGVRWADMQVLCCMPTEYSATTHACSKLLLSAHPPTPQCHHPHTLKATAVRAPTHPSVPLWAHASPIASTPQHLHPNIHPACAHAGGTPLTQAPERGDGC